MTEGQLKKGNQILIDIDVLEKRIKRYEKIIPDIESWIKEGEVIEHIYHGDITEKEAIRELLILFGVSNMLRRLKNHAEIYSYPSKSFKEKLKKFISNYC